MKMDERPACKPSKRLLYSDDAYEDAAESPWWSEFTAERIGIPREDVTASMILETANQAARDDYRIEKESIDTLAAGRRVIVSGEQGLWNGTFSIFGTAESPSKIIDEIASHADRLVIWDENGSLKIEGHHHDGLNRYELRFLTSDGVDYLDAAREGGHDQFEELCRAFADASFAELPRAAEKLYGYPPTEWEPFAACAPTSSEQAASLRAGELDSTLQHARSAHNATDCGKQGPGPCVQPHFAR